MNTKYLELRPRRSHNILSNEETDNSSSTMRLKVELEGESDTWCMERIDLVQGLQRSPGVSRDVIANAKYIFYWSLASMVEALTVINKTEEHLVDLADIGILEVAGLKGFRRPSLGACDMSE